MNLEKIKKFANSWGIFILLVFVLFKSCGTASEAKDATEIVEENSTLVDSTLISISERFEKVENKTITKKEVRDVMEEVMLDFLIYEEELDKKQITISRIKDKIKQND